VSAVFPTASGLPDSSLIKVSAAQPSPSATHGAADSSELKTQQIYQTVVALVAVFCIFSFFCLVAALVFVFHTRRKRALTKLRDAESQAYDNSQWLTPNHIVPFTGLQEVPLSGAPQRPKNPFADQFPPNVPLELETPSESTLVNKRGDRDVRRPRSSFGNGLYDYYVPRR
jgi:hypothetical protein